jgi:hypothetical protein
MMLSLGPPSAQGAYTEGTKETGFNSKLPRPDQWSDALQRTRHGAEAAATGLLELADHLEPDHRHDQPAATNVPVKGSAGHPEFLEEGGILEAQGAKLVDNAWAAPGATGCGGFLVELILAPIVNASAGLPAAGKNIAVLINNIFVSPALLVLIEDEEHP